MRVEPVLNDDIPPGGHNCKVVIRSHGEFTHRFAVHGGTIAQAGEAAWLAAGRPLGCQVIVRTDGREVVSTLVPEVLETIRMRCLEQEAYREQERGE